jgi:hypothetical protein
MTYTRATIRTRIQQKLDDTSFDTATLNQFIDDGQRDILNSRRFVFMERESDVTTTAGVNTLTGLPTDMQVPLSLRVYTPVGNATLLDYIEYEDLDRSVPNITNNGQTPPSAWYVFNLIPYIYPLADATYTLKLKYIKSATTLDGDADVPEIPESFGEALVLAGYKRALEFNDDYDQAQVIQLKIDELVELMDERYNKRQAGLPHFIRQPLRTKQPRRF